MSSQEKSFRHYPSTKIRVVPQTLKNLFEQHGNQFLKWNLLPFLKQKERSSLRASCTLVQKFIPAPQFVYTKNKFSGPLLATARLEKNTGFVETRGHVANGGDSSGVANHLQSNVIKIWSTGYAFAALKKNGSVITWGDPLRGGNSLSVYSGLQGGVTKIYGNRLAFAALKQGGKVVTWGHPIRGGDSSSVSSELQSGVTNIFATNYAFAALKFDGKVISWGSYFHGGGHSRFSIEQTGVITLESVYKSNKFRATKSDGTITEWP